MRHSTIIAFLLLSIALPGCVSVGPATISRDRFNYNVAIRESWQEQILANIVNLRYGEAPVFLDIDSVIAQYSLETSGQLAGGVNNSFTGDNALTAGGGVVWQERPTITYTPVQGNEFTVNMLTPIDLNNLFALIDAGWNADLSLQLILKSINGVSYWNSQSQELNPAYFAVLNAFKILQDEQALGIRQAKDEANVRTFVSLRDVARNTAIDQAATTIVQVLGLNPDYDEFEVIYGAAPGKDNQLTLQTLSVLDIMSEMAVFVQAPEVHVADGRTLANRRAAFDSPQMRPPLRVLSSRDKPEDALVFIENRGYYFYVDDRDIVSKKALSFLMVLLNLSASQADSRGPVVTIGTGG